MPGFAVNGEVSDGLPRRRISPWNERRTRCGTVGHPRSRRVGAQRDERSRRRGDGDADWLPVGNQSGVQEQHHRTAAGLPGGVRETVHCSRLPAVRGRAVRC